MSFQRIFFRRSLRNKVEVGDDFTASEIKHLFKASAAPCVKNYRTRQQSGGILSLFSCFVKCAIFLEEESYILENFPVLINLIFSEFHDVFSSFELQ